MSFKDTIPLVLSTLRNVDEYSMFSGYYGDTLGNSEFRNLGF